MGETKPKWGAKNVVDLRPINNEVIEDIKQRNPNINFEETESAIVDLKRACEGFLGKRELHSSKNRVRRSNKIAALKAMLYKGRSDGPLPALIKMLKGIDPDTKSFLKIETRLADFSDPSLLGNFSIEDLVMNLEIFNQAVIEGYEKVNKEKDSGGRPLDQALKEFLENLWSIYKKCTGKSAKRVYNVDLAEGYGPFPKFVHNCICALNLDKDYPFTSIPPAIQRYIKK